MNTEAAITSREKWEKNNPKKSKERKRVWAKKQRLENPDFVRLRDRMNHWKYRERRLTNGKVQWALESGKLIKSLKCEVCDCESFLYGHHDDYSKPLEVRWVCKECHYKIHRRDA